MTESQVHDQGRDPAMGKCANCGFLAQKRLVDSVLVGATYEMRERGHSSSSAEGTYAAFPECAERALNVSEEIRTAPGEGLPDKILAIINQESKVDPII
jgi:hypothetical protein